MESWSWMENWGTEEVICVIFQGLYISTEKSWSSLEKTPNPEVPMIK